MDRRYRGNHQPEIATRDYTKRAAASACDALCNRKKWTEPAAALWRGPGESCGVFAWELCLENDRSAARWRSGQWTYADRTQGRRDICTLEAGDELGSARAWGADPEDRTSDRCGGRASTPCARQLDQPGLSGSRSYSSPRRVQRTGSRWSMDRRYCGNH